MRCFAPIALFALLLGCEEEPLIRNPLVDRWCGERPCGWEAQGEIERVGSWHEHDYAVSFLSDDAQLSQYNATANARQHDCFSFSMIAKVERGTKLYLELDFLDDGEKEFSERIPESDWDLRTFLITPPTWYEGVRFVIRKDGPGYAALAQLAAEATSGCTAQPLDLRGRPGGAVCEHDEQCEHGRCDTGICGSCANDDDCGAGEVCGAATNGLTARSACVALGGTPFAEHCAKDEQCETGICCGGVCSTCCADTDCEGELSCGLPKLSSGGADRPSDLPRLCGPGQAQGVEGDACTADADCASGTCDGAGLECAGQCSGDCFICVPRFVGGVCR